MRQHGFRAVVISLNMAQALKSFNTALIMNRAFVNEDNLAAAQTAPERPLSDKPNYVTVAGLAQLQTRLAAINAQLDQLRLHAETPERALALEPLARDQRYLLARIGSAMPVTPPVEPEQVSFGCRVEIGDEDGLQNVQIVGEDEADAAAGKIAWTSPLARALQGAAVGDVVIWERPIGPREIEVLAVAAS